MHHLCSDEEALAAWFDGLLTPSEEEAFKRSLLECAACCELVATLGLIIEDEASGALKARPIPAAVTNRAIGLWPKAPSAIQRGLRLAVRWIEGQLAPLADAMQPMQAAGVMVRGGETLDDLLRYETQVGPYSLEIGLEVDGPQQVSLTVRPLSDPPSGLLLRLSQGGEMRAMSTLSTDGATVSALNLGAYELILESGHDEIGRMTLELN